MYSQEYMSTEISFVTFLILWYCCLCPLTYLEQNKLSVKYNFLWTFHKFCHTVVAFLLLSVNIYGEKCLKILFLQKTTKIYLPEVFIQPVFLKGLLSLKAWKCLHQVFQIYADICRKLGKVNILFLIKKFVIQKTLSILATKFPLIKASSATPLESITI